MLVLKIALGIFLAPVILLIIYIAFAIVCGLIYLLWAFISYLFSYGLALLLLIFPFIIFGQIFSSVGLNPLWSAPTVCLIAWTYNLLMGKPCLQSDLSEPKLLTGREE